MKEEQREEAATPLTLGDIVDEFAGDIEIVNECNETLVKIVASDENVCSLKKVLCKELLNRTILKHYVLGPDLFVIKIEGVEDAD